MVALGSEPFNNSIEREVIIECGCGTHSIKIHSFDDESMLYLEMWTSNFYSKQKASIFRRIYDRLKRTWQTIRGKDYLLEDIVINKEDLDKLISALQEIRDNKQEVKK
jgi:hypothetical protein